MAKVAVEAPIRATAKVRRVLANMMKFLVG
jgi:hypothetical protein